MAFNRLILLATSTLSSLMESDPFAPLWRYAIVAGAFVALGWILKRLKERSDRKIQLQAKDWPYVYGPVEHARPKLIGEGDSAYWVGELAYSYAVEGNYYSGFHDLPVRGEEQAWEAVDGWKDRRIIVHYLAGRPSVSALVIEEQSGLRAGMQPNAQA